MAKKPQKSIKKGEEIKSISKEELQNMKFNISIEIPKEGFDELIKAMLGTDEANEAKHDIEGNGATI